MMRQFSRYRTARKRVLQEARPGPVGFLFFLLFLSFFLPAAPCRGLVPLPRGDRDYDEAANFIFLEDDLPEIEVTLDSALFVGFLADPWQDDYQRCTVRFRNSRIDETIHNVGIRVRGYTSRIALKKSWKLSFNKFVKGRKFHGLEKMNINGDVDDISFIRSRLMWKHFKKMGVPSPRSHHVRLKINDGSEVEGVFIHVEQVDEEMVEAWFGSQNGSLYKCLYKQELADLRWIDPGDGDVYRTLGDGRVYSEKNLDSPDYEDLAAFIDFINHADDEVFASELVERFSVDSFLRAMAIDVVAGNWDNYWFGANNYYLYHDPETDRFEYIPHDMDDTFGIDYFGIDWSTRRLETWGNDGIGSTNGELPPLIARVLDVPAFEGQLRYYIREFSDGPFSLPQCEEEIDRIRTMILPYVLEGSYRDGRMDRGYTKIMFMNSYTMPTSFVEGVCRSTPSIFLCPVREGRMFGRRIAVPIGLSPRRLPREGRTAGREPRRMRGVTPGARLRSGRIRRVPTVAERRSHSGSAGALV